MIRKFILPVMAAGLLAGCVTPGYQYRGGSGDYYYGRGTTGVPYGYGSIGYGSRGGWYGGMGYGMSYGYPYGHGYYPGYYPGYVPYPVYRPPYHPRPYPRPHPPRPWDGQGPQPPGDAATAPRPRAPWRDLDGLRRGGERTARGEAMMMPPSMAERAQAPVHVAPPEQSRGAMRSVYSEQRAIRSGERPDRQDEP